MKTSDQTRHLCELQDIRTLVELAGAVDHFSVLLDQAVDKHGYSRVAGYLNVSEMTLRRWQKSFPDYLTRTGVVYYLSTIEASFKMWPHKS